MEQNATKGMGGKALSTSALAKRDELKAAELFGWMEEQGWIIRVEGQWSLTGLGRQQGGTVHTSERLGSYIVWPSSYHWHRANGAIWRVEAPAPSLMSATALVEAYEKATPLGGRALSAGTLNRLFLECGWLMPNHEEESGWLVSKEGEARGAVQRRTKNEIPFVVWPESILMDERLAKLIRLWQGSLSDSLTSNLSSQKGHGYFAINGLWCSSLALLGLVNTLYLHRVAHRLDMPLTDHHSVTADLFLPDLRVVIMIADARAQTDQLKQQHAVDTLCKEQALTLWNFSEGDAKQIDQLLLQKLKSHRV